MNMTWGQFKKLVDEAEGVDDDSDIWYIDISFPSEDSGLDHPEAHIDKDGLGLVVS